MGNMHKIALSGLLFSALILSNVYGSDVIIQKETFFQEVMDLAQPRHIFVPPETKEPWIIFSSKNDMKIIAKSIDGKYSIQLNEGHKGTSGGTAYFVQKNFLHVAWREKTTTKELFFRSLEFPSIKLSQPISIDTQTEALTRIVMDGTEKGEIILVWYGEKGDGKRKRYSLYSSSSEDFGKTFSSVTDLTPQSQYSIWPNLAVDSEGNAYVFAEVVKDQKREMIVRKKTKNGWEEPVSIGQIGTVTIFIRPVITANRIMVFWFNTYDDGIPITEMAYSDDGGKTWKRQVLEATRYLDLTGMQVNTDNQNNLYLFISGVKKDQQPAEATYDERDQRPKDNVYLLVSRDNGTTFSNLIPLRHYPYALTKAQFLSAVVDGKRIVVVWNDYRNIRANIYMNYSNDGGLTWQSQDIPLEEPGKFNTVLYLHKNNLIYHDGVYYVLAHRFENDAFENPHPIVISFKIKK